MKDAKKTSTVCMPKHPVESVMSKPGEIKNKLKIGTLNTEFVFVFVFLRE